MVCGCALSDLALGLDKSKLSYAVGSGWMREEARGGTLFKGRIVKLQIKSHIN